MIADGEWRVEAAGEGPGRACRDVRVVVALAPGGPATEHIYGKLTVPVGESPRTIQLLVHAAFNQHIYWELPDPRDGTDRYNYVAAASKAGFATLSIDRVGAGKSSRPPSTSLTLDSNAFTVHQVVQAVRRGEITAPDGGRFEKIVFVGESYSSWIGWYLATDYGDGLDGAAFLGCTHKPTVTTQMTVLPNLYPAALDPKFAGQGLDMGYLTTAPGSQTDMAFKPAEFDPLVVDINEATKGTATVTELVCPEVYSRPLDVRVPTLLVVGTCDSNIATECFELAPVLTVEPDVLEKILAPFRDVSTDVPGVRLGGTDCSSPQALIDEEGPFLGPHVPSLDAYILAGAGHSLVWALNALDFFDAVNEWVADKVSG